MDKLDEIFSMQEAFDAQVIQTRQLQHITPEEWIQKDTLAMMDELSELINEVNYKWWKNPQPIDRESVKGELVDILHFFVSMCLKMEMTGEELHARYCEKNKENFDRQAGLSAKPGYALSELAEKGAES